MGEGDNDMVIGELRGTLTALIKSVDDSNDASRESRLRTYNKIEELNAVVHRVEGYIGKVDDRVAGIEARVKKIEPVAEDVQKWKERGIGAVMLIGFASGGIGVVGAMLWKSLMQKLGIH